MAEKDKINQYKRAGLSGHSSNVQILRFLVTYLLLMGLALFVMGYEPIKQKIDINGVYSNAIATITAVVLNASGMEAEASGAVLDTPGASLEIKFGCNGLEAVLIYAIAILSFPASWKKKVAGIAAGFVVLQVFNVVRIAALALVHEHLPRFFDIFHIYVAQGMMIALALALFMVWMAYAKSGS